MEVFVVTEGNYDDERVVAVFSNQGAANNLAQSIEAGAVLPFPVEDTVDTVKWGWLVELYLKTGGYYQTPRRTQRPQALGHVEYFGGHHMVRAWAPMLEDAQREAEAYRVVVQREHLEEVEM